MAATKIDWLKAKTEYVSDPTLSLKDIAKKYGVSETVTEERASKEKWVELRRTTLEKAGERLGEKLPETIAEINARHARMGRTLQGKGLKVIMSKDPETFDDARLSVMSGIRIEREALGISDEQLQDQVYQKFQQFTFIFSLNEDELQRFITAALGAAKEADRDAGTGAAQQGAQAEEGTVVDAQSVSG